MGRIECDVGLEEGRLDEGYHSMDFANLSTHREVELEEGKMDHVVEFREMCEEELFRGDKTCFAKLVNHVWCQHLPLHFGFLRCQREIVGEIVEMHGDEEIYLRHKS